MSKTPEYLVWSAMRQRCSNPNHHSYQIYGQRGITVCAEWDTNFAQFLVDMGRRPSGDHQLERVDNDLGYSPQNCIWALKSVQANNTRTNRFLTAFGERKTLAQWGRDPRCKVATSALRKRLTRGWPLEDAILTAFQKSRYAGGAQNARRSHATAEAAALHGKALASLTSKEPIE